MKKIALLAIGLTVAMLVAVGLVIINEARYWANFYPDGSYFKIMAKGHRKCGPLFLRTCYYFVRADAVRFPVSKEDYDKYSIGDYYEWKNPWHETCARIDK